MKIAIDAMGGDNAPREIVAGALLARHSLGTDIVLVGNEKSIKECLPKDFSDPGVIIHHCTEIIAMDENPAAVRTKKDSSIVVCAQLVKKGEADAMVSAGSTAAAMAAATLHLGRIAGIDRPAIATVFPSVNGKTLLLDAGANADCTVENLGQFAIMGSIYSKSVLQVENPKIGLLSIGEESCKGNELTKKAHELLKMLPINFIGNVEGNDIFKDTVDVVVCDGFVGNVVLKCSEGVSEFLKTLVKQEISGKPWIYIPLAMLAPVLKHINKRVDYSEYGGAPLLGVSGVCIISHGKSSAKAISNAVKAAAEAVSHDILGDICAYMEEAQSKLAIGITQ